MQIVPQCFECKHYEGDKKCKAYPDGIPERIYTSVKKLHDTVEKDQKGNYVFTPSTDESNSD
jgi:hypothetical protein